MSTAPALTPGLDAIRLDLGGEPSPLAAIRTAAHAAVLRHRANRAIARRAVHQSLTPAAYRREVANREPDR